MCLPPLPGSLHSLLCQIFCFFAMQRGGAGVERAAPGLFWPSLAHQSGRVSLQTKQGHKGKLHAPRYRTHTSIPPCPSVAALFAFWPHHQKQWLCFLKQENPPFLLQLTAGAKQGAQRKHHSATGRCLLLLRKNTEGPLLPESCSKELQAKRTSSWAAGGACFQ